MNSIRRSQSQKITYFMFVIALACACRFTNNFFTGIANAQSIAKNYSNGQHQMAGNQKKNVQPALQSRADNLLKDALRQSDQDKENVGLKSGSVNGPSKFLADGQTSEDEPLLQKFIKKLGAIIWG